MDAAIVIGTLVYIGLYVRQTSILKRLELATDSIEERLAHIERRCDNLAAETTRATLGIGAILADVQSLDMDMDAIRRHLGAEPDTFYPSTAPANGGNI